MGRPDIEKMKRERDVDGLIKVLREDAHFDVRFEAISALAELRDKKAVEPLIEAMDEDPDGGNRIRAIWALGEIKDERAVEPLLKKLVFIDPFWRPNVVYALGQIGDKRAVEPLKILLEDNDVRVRSTAKEALEKIQKKLQ